MKKINLLIILSIGFSFSSQAANLEEELQNIKQNAVAAKVPQVPVYDVKLVNYKKFGSVNSFLSTRLESAGYKPQAINDFALNQLEMVGYMQDGSTKYAFIKTPYETIMLKPGDKIKSGQVTMVNESGVSIQDTLVDDTGKIYQKIINLKYINDNDVRLKLQ